MLDLFGTDWSLKKEGSFISFVWIKMLNELKIVLFKPFFFCTVLNFFRYA